jgi:hypothetical protein
MKNTIILLSAIFLLATPVLASELYPTPEEQRRFDNLQKPYADQVEKEIWALKVKQKEMDDRLNKIEIEQGKRRLEDYRRSHGNPAQN